MPLSWHASVSAASCTLHASQDCCACHGNTPNANLRCPQGLIVYLQYLVIVMRLGLSHPPFLRGVSALSGWLLASGDTAGPAAACLRRGVGAGGQAAGQLLGGLLLPGLVAAASVGLWALRWGRGGCLLWFSASARVGAACYCRDAMHRTEDVHSCLCMRGGVTATLIGVPRTTLDVKSVSHRAPVPVRPSAALETGTATSPPPGQTARPVSETATAAACP